MQKFEFDLSDRGSGKTLLMLPGSYATPAAWKGIVGDLTGSYRMLSTSLPGYGTTPEVRQKESPDVDPMIEFVGQVVDSIGEPVHVVGHSWGAHLALGALLRGRIAPLSLIAFEANPLFARPADQPFEWRPELDAMVEKFKAALAADDPSAAAIIIDFYSREGTFDAMPDSVRAYCQATAPTNLLDWYSASSFTPAFAEFAQVRVPVTLVRGGATPRAIVDVTDQLGANLPRARQRIVEGADHFLISTHTSQCAALIEEHIEYATSR